MQAVRLLTFLKGNKLVMPLSCVAAIAMLVGNELTYLYTTRYTQESIAIVRTQAILNDSHVRMLNAEAGQRDYLLTERPEHLVPYNNAIELVPQNFLELRQRYAEQSASLALVSELELLSRSKFKEMAQAITLKQNQPSAASLNQIIESSASREGMRRMRTVTDTLLTLEADRLIILQSKMQRTLMISRIGVALLSLMCLFAMLIYLRKNLRLKSEQLELRQQLAVERDRLGITVRKRTDELTQLARYLQNNREDERSRLARNLHDDLGALLTSAKLDAARIKSRLDPSYRPMVELLEHLVGNLNASIALGRKIIEDLRPSALNNLGLVSTLEIFAREFADSSDLKVHSSFEDVDLPANSQLMVYRLMQEACTNIMKYAKAKSVWLKLGVVDGVIVASVRDDGVGFDTDKQIRSSYGLLGMRHRVEAAQGVLNIASTPGQGTLVQALL